MKFLPYFSLYVCMLYMPALFAGDKGVGQEPTSALQFSPAPPSTPDMFAGDKKIVQSQQQEQVSSPFDLQNMVTLFQFAPSPREIPVCRFTGIPTTPARVLDLFVLNPVKTGYKVFVNNQRNAERQEKTKKEQRALEDSKDMEKLVKAMGRRLEYEQDARQNFQPWIAAMKKEHKLRRRIAERTAEDQRNRQNGQQCSMM